MIDKFTAIHDHKACIQHFDGKIENDKYSNSLFDLLKVKTDFGNPNGENNYLGHDISK